MKIGLCQLDIFWEDKEKNFAKFSKYLEDASADGIDLLLFPEMTFTGFSMNTFKIAESDYQTQTKVRELARINKINIGFGWVESYNDKARNHYTVVSGNGDVLSDYVKIHPFTYAEENKHYYSGNEISNFKLGDFQISTFICYDLRFPEIFQAASKNCDLIIVSANWPSVRMEHWDVLLRARAIENQVYIAGVNCTGFRNDIAYVGHSAIYDPVGIAQNDYTESEGIITTEISIEMVRDYRASFPLKMDRKNDLYKKLL